MNRNTSAMFAASAIALSLAVVTSGIGAPPPPPRPENAKPPQTDVTRAAPSAESVPPSLEEARGRARLLHETMHATLQIVHQEFFREDKGIPIPAATLKKVFRELAVRQKVELRWLAVNAQAMNDDHKPQNDFEQQAVRALASGKEEFELVEDGVFRHVGVITLASECLRCHVPNRMSTKDRAAGLIISMRIQQPK